MRGQRRHQRRHDRGVAAALDDASPGQVIRLADGHYVGLFTATADVTEQDPISLCGSRLTVLDGGSISGGYTLHLDGGSHWQVVGFSITGGQKDVMVDAGVGNLLTDLSVSSIGDQAIHLRRNSTDNVVRDRTSREIDYETHLAAELLADRPWEKTPGS